MAIVSGVKINRIQYEEFLDKLLAADRYDEFRYRISVWPDGGVTIDDGDSILIEMERHR